MSSIEKTSSSCRNIWNGVHGVREFVKTFKVGILVLQGNQFLKKIKKIIIIIIIKYIYFCTQRCSTPEYVGDVEVLN
jgi:hypothetical protein